MGKREDEARALASSSAPYERCKAARRKKCPPDVLVALTSDSHSYVAKLAWGHPGLPEAQLWKGVNSIAAIYREGGMINWAHPLVGIISNPSLTSDMILKANLDLLLSHPNFPQNEMERVCREGTVHDKKILATNRSLTPQAQILLATDKVTAVRIAISRNTNINNDTAAILAEDKSPVVLRNIIKHPSIQSKKDTIVVKLKGKRKGLASSMVIARYTKDPEDLKAAVANGEYGVAWSALQNEKVTEEVLETACYNKNKWIRSMAADHEACPEEGRIAATLLGRYGTK